MRGCRCHWRAAAPLEPAAAGPAAGSAGSVPAEQYAAAAACCTHPCVATDGLHGVSLAPSAAGGGEDWHAGHAAQNMLQPVGCHPQPMLVLKSQYLRAASCPTGARRQMPSPRRGRRARCRREPVAAPAGRGTSAARRHAGPTTTAGVVPGSIAIRHARVPATPKSNRALAALRPGIARRAAPCERSLAVAIARGPTAAAVPRPRSPKDRPSRSQWHCRDGDAGGAAGPDRAAGGRAVYCARSGAAPGALPVNQVRLIRRQPARAEPCAGCSQAESAGLNAESQVQVSAGGQLGPAPSQRCHRHLPLPCWAGLLSSGAADRRPPSSGTMRCSSSCSRWSRSSRTSSSAT